MTIRALIPYLIITFGLAWGLFAILTLYQDQVVSIFGPVSATNPLFIVSVYAPAIAAVSLVLWTGGIDAAKRFLSRLFLWRASPYWYAFLIFGIPWIYFAGSAVKGNLFDTPFPFENVSAALAGLGFMLILGPVEEFGWRGVALPLLQRHVAPIWAGLVLGMIWGVWHLPAFFLSGTPQSAWGFTPFFIGSIAVSLILTPFFNNARGSILIAVLFHFQLNNPLWPDAQPYDTIFFVLAALGAIWFNRDSMFNRDGAIIEVIPQSVRDDAGSGAH